MKTARAMCRRLRAGSRSPLAITALLAATSVLTTSGAVASPSAAPTATNPPSIQIVPAQPIQQPATVSPKGQVAPAVPAFAHDTATPTVTIGGIPAVALAAYQRAAQLINQADPSCTMRWQLIGAIGRVESDNGQFGGNHLTAEGVAVPGIYGPALDGSNGVGLVRDTDGGRLDHDSTYDRAVGPMQFLPGTWAMLGVPSTADGQHGPQNIYDAALATAKYLCSGGGTMSNPSDVRSAVFRYNHSDAYVALVVGIARAYGAGSFSTIPVAAYATPSRPATSTAKSTKAPSKPSKASRPAGSVTPKPAPIASPVTHAPQQAQGSNLVQALLSGLTGSTPAPTAPPVSSAPMSSTQAAAYCASHLSGYIDLFGTLHAACKTKLTGMTPTQAATGWAAHQSDLATWFAE